MIRARVPPAGLNLVVPCANRSIVSTARMLFDGDSTLMEHARPNMDRELDDDKGGNRGGVLFRGVLRR